MYQSYSEAFKGLSLLLLLALAGWGLVFGLLFLFVNFPLVMWRVSYALVGVAGIVFATNDFRNWRDTSRMSEICLVFSVGSLTADALGVL